jgi:hypothetical protein
MFSATASSSVDDQDDVYNFCDRSPEAALNTDDSVCDHFLLVPPPLPLRTMKG